MIRVIDETGPAEAATSPGRGSNNPGKENAVNSPMHTTAPGGAARAPFDYETAYYELEDPVVEAVSRVNVLCVVSDHLSELEAKDGFYRVSAEKVDAILYMVMEVHRKVVEVDKLMQATSKLDLSAAFDNVTQGREIKAARDQDESALADLIYEHRAATIAWDSWLSVPDVKDGVPIALPGAVAAQARWEKACATLLSWRPTTLEGNAARVSYLTHDQHGLWRDTRPTESELAILFASMAEPA